MHDTLPLNFRSRNQNATVIDIAPKSPCTLQVSAVFKNPLPTPYVLVMILYTSAYLHVNSLGQVSIEEF